MRTVVFMLSVASLNWSMLIDVVDGKVLVIPSLFVDELLSERWLDFLLPMGLNRFTLLLWFRGS